MSVAPPVSVITVVHNGMPYLPATVDSMLAQSFGDFEYVIVDDGSNDGTTEYLKGIVDRRVRIVQCEKIGLANVRNVAVETARGEFLGNIDADDLAYPQRLEKQVEFLIENRDHVVVGSQAHLIDPDDRIIGERRNPCGDATLRFQILFGCPFVHPTTTYRRDATLRCGRFLPKYNYTEDYEFWTRLAMEGRLANLDEHLVGYRIHPKSVTTQHSEVHTRHSCEFVAEYAGRLGIEIDRETQGELYRFLQSGTPPGESSPNDLVDCYRTIRAWFCRSVPMDAELERQFQFIQQRLRWICLEKASACWHRPLQAWRWVRLAGGFDPEEGSITNIARRTARKIFRTRTKSTRNVESQTSHGTESERLR